MSEGDDDDHIEQGEGGECKLYLKKKN